MNTRIAEAVTQRFGLMSRTCWSEEIEAAVNKLADAHGCAPAQVVEAALDTDDLLREIASHLTVVETYFLRHTQHFELLVAFMRNQLGRPPGDRPLRVLSAGCGTGEEPYSMVISLLEGLGPQAAQIEVVATDLDHHAIAAARQGIYRPWAFRGTSSSFRARYFEPLDPARARLIDRIRARVSFESEPILSYLLTRPPNSIDAIFFRNVSIYLEQESFEQIAEGFFRVLAPGGLLVTSPADRVPPANLFTHHEDMGMSAYWRADPSLAAGARDPGPTRGSGRTRSTRQRRSQPRPAPSTDPKIRDGSICTRALPAAEPLLDSHVQQILALGNCAQFERALELADELVVAAPTTSGAFLLRGQLQFALGHFDLALADLRRAVFLDGENDGARMWLAIAHSSCGRVQKARLQLRDLARRLAGPSARVDREGEELRRAVTSMLES